MGAVQIDSVDINTKFPGLVIDRCQYVSVLDDILTRYNWVRPLQNKKAGGVVVVEHCYESFQLFEAEDPPEW